MVIVNNTWQGPVFAKWCRCSLVVIKDQKRIMTYLQSFWAFLLRVLMLPVISIPATRANWYNDKAITLHYFFRLANVQTGNVYVLCFSVVLLPYMIERYRLRRNEQKMLDLDDFAVRKICNSEERLAVQRQLRFSGETRSRLRCCVQIYANDDIK